MVVMRCDPAGVCLFVSLFGLGGACGPSTSLNQTMDESSGSSAPASTSSSDATSRPTTSEGSSAGPVGETTGIADASGGTTGGQQGTSTTTAGADCPSQEVVIDLTPGRILFVLERSSSMMTLWDHDYDDTDDDGIVDNGVDAATPKVTRWSSVHRALAGTLSNAVTQHEYGVLLFPADDADAPPADDACELGPTPQLAVGSHPVEDVIAALPPADANDLGGASPTRAALAAATDALGPPVEGWHRSVVYIGDGAGNCAEGAVGDARFEVADPAALDPLEQGLADGIQFQVMVVNRSQSVNPPVVDGEPDGVAPDDMFTQAVLLGVPGTYADYEEILTWSLEYVLDPPAPDCLVDLDHPWPVERVEVSGQIVPPSESCLGDGYWQTNDWTIFLCNAACDTFRAEGRVEVFFSACDP